MRGGRGRRGCPRVPLAPTLGGAPSSQGFRRGRERFHGGVAPRGSVRGEGGGDSPGGDSPGAGCEPLLAALSAPVRQTTATVSQQARRLEAALMCVAELAAPPVSDASIAFQESFMDELLATGESSPLANPSRATRDEAAKLAAQLIGAHGGDDEDVACVGVDHERLHAGLRAKANALLAQFVECAPDACREALERRPSDARHLDGDGSMNPDDPGVVVVDLDRPSDPQTKGEGFKAPEGRGQHWLEGSFLTVIQLAKHGGVANVAGSVAKMLPFVLKVQECPDREFALVAKRTLTYLKYLVFPRRHLAAAVAGTLEGMRDSSQWHARAAGLKFCQAFSYRHSFTLSEDEMAALRDETFDRLCDAQIEVRSLARDTLVGFLKGVGAVSAAAAGVRARCLAAAAELPPRKRGRPPPERRRRLRRRSTRPVRRREGYSRRGRQGGAARVRPRSQRVRPVRALRRAGMDAGSVGGALAPRQRAEPGQGHGATGVLGV